LNKKLLLFDIDGTLLSAQGVPKKVFMQILHRRFPEYAHGSSLNFSGMTDPQIAMNILKMNHSQHSDNRQLIQDLLNDFLDELSLHITSRNPPRIYPGVIELLETCRYRRGCFLGLVTGNMQRGAYIKLSACGLQNYFPVGAFGSDSPDRNQLPPIATQRAEAFYGRQFKKEDIWIIGDSIYDVRCARVNNLHCLAVCTGLTEAAILKAEHPDAIVSDFRDTQKIMEILCS